MAEAAHDREQAAKACQRADELFRAGNICGAHRQASKARRLCPSLPGVANVHAAYEVLLAAGANANWRTVLGIRPGAAATDDAIKKQFRRLSLLVHPDKNGCAAAEEAFKLLRQAFDDALAARSEDRGPPRDRDAAHDKDEAPRDATHEKPRRSRTAARDEPRRRRTAARNKEPRRRTAARDENPPLQCEKIRRVTIYCPFCDKEFIGYVAPREEKYGKRCARCPELLHPPWQAKPPGDMEPPTPERFPCPARCPKCEAQYPSKVCVGTWRLDCKACSTSTIFDVRGPDMATARCPTRRGPT